MLKPIRELLSNGGIINTEKNQTGGGDPLQKLQKILDVVSASEIEAHFTDEREKPVLTRAYIEMVIEEFSQQAQSPQLNNKFIALDIKLTKALKEYKAELRVLLAGQAQMGAAQATLQAEAPEETPPAAPEPQRSTAADRALPTQPR